MEIAITTFETCVGVCVSGHLDRRTTPELEDVLQKLIATGGQHSVILDLTAATEMSSAGLRLLISVAKRLRNSKPAGDLRLVAPGKRIVEVLDLAGLLTVLPAYESLEEAVASFDRAKSQEPASVK